MEPQTYMEATPEDLKKVLEWELTLDNNDLRSHAWYHGTIPRQRAEELMSDEGDFLIRDCISRPGDYVLTCKWNSTWLHFVINKVVFQPFTVYEKIQYQFEDDCFDTVPDLVTYYVGNKRPISAASGAIVSKPVNRSMPLSYYATRYGLECQMHYATIALEKASESSGRKSKKDAVDGGPLRRKSQPSENPKTDDVTGSATMPRQSSSIDYAHRNGSSNTLESRSKSLQLDHGIYPSKTTPNQLGAVTSVSPSSDTKVDEVRRESETLNESNEPATCRVQNSGEEDSPPPKPSRQPSVRYSTTVQIGKMDPIASQTILTGNEAPSTISSHLYSEPNYPVKTPADSSSKDLNLDQSKDDQSSKKSETLTIPDLHPPSNYDLENFVTLLLPKDNKPLDPPALARMRCLLLELGPRVIASHLTKADIDTLRISGQTDMGVGVNTGYELLLLPQGQQFRLDLLERTECMKYFVAITVLTCGDEEVRAQLLNKWIQVAVETKTALGNLYGFTGVMQGLALPQVSRLRSTWLKLRQTCTDIAFTYETKLRPTLKNMQDCTNPQAPNTCIPYLMSLLLILQRHHDSINGNEEAWDTEEDIQKTPLVENKSIFSKETSKVLKLGLPWELTAADYGIQLLLTHLEIGRSVNQQWQTYRRNSEIVLENAKFDDLVLDMFRTEFHLRFLWGFRGSHVSSKERYSKLLQVLNVMSERCEPA